MLDPKQSTPFGDLTHCPRLGYAIHTFRCERECREDHSCPADLACPLAGEFLFDDGPSALVETTNARVAQSS